MPSFFNHSSKIMEELNDEQIKEELNGDEQIKVEINDGIGTKPAEKSRKRKLDETDGHDANEPPSADNTAGGSTTAEWGADPKIMRMMKMEEMAQSSTPTAAKRARQERQLQLAIAGCSHGQMDTIYEQLTNMERQQNVKFDLLICCGDFQAIRNHGDLHYYYASLRHRKLGDFYKYYSGQKVAPILTLFVGGNHESSGFMAELPNGGWVAPNIYFMGYSSVVQFAGLRIAGLSGIYKSNDYNRGHFERPPFNEHASIVSAYHVRSLEVFRLRQLRDTKVDICISHDWPAGITDFGDKDWLLQIKPYFTKDIMLNRLGNPATMNLIYELKPAHWFAAHMHVRFTAVVPHCLEGDASRTPDSQETRFLALDKPTANDNRQFLECMELPIDEDAPMELRYDPHWLAILKSTDELMEFTARTVHMPGEMPGVIGADRHDYRPSQEELEAIAQAFGNDFRIPLNFQRTAPPESEPWNGNGRPASFYYRNPQTQQFCERLGIRDLNFIFAQASVNHLGVPYFMTEAAAAAVENNPEEIDLGDEDEFGDDGFVVDVAGVEPTANE